MKKIEIYAGDYKLIIGEKTLIMGILNITPDSFSDGGDYLSVENAVELAKKMEADGADIIDIGGESTRPGFTEISVKEELERVIPVIKALKKEINIPISIDTSKSEVASEAIKAGASIVNDIWGLKKDPNMAKTVAELKVPIIIMHNKENNIYEKDIMIEIAESLETSIKIGRSAGICDDYMVLDPGIGFGKNPDQNIEVMSRLEELKKLGFPILLGTSRKSMIGKILNGIPPKERTAGTVATTVIGISKGVADIVRVHDVKENLQAARITEAILSATTTSLKRESKDKNTDKTSDKSTNKISDKIIMSEMAFFGYHGVLEEEKKLGQKFYISLELLTDLAVAGKTDLLEGTISYADVYYELKKIVEDERFDLIEALGERIADVLLEKFSALNSIKVQVRKPEAPIPGIFGWMGIEIVRAREI